MKKATVGAFAIVAVGLATGAAAQTTADCTTWGSSTHCQTSAPPPTSGLNIDFGLLGTPHDYVGDYARAYQQGQQIAAERAAQEQARVAQQQSEAAIDAENQRRAAQWRDEQDQKTRAVRAGQLIAAGHCEEARAGALNAGDLDLAAHVATLCPAK